MGRRYQQTAKRNPNPSIGSWPTWAIEQYDWTGSTPPGDLDALNPSTSLSSLEITSTPAPTVTNVVVASTNWQSTFLNYLSSLGSQNAGGYSIPVGSGAQLKPLPWSNINEIEVQFSENVTVAQADLALTGVNTTSYSVSGFAYNPTTFTATWTLPQAIADNKLLIELNAAGSNPIEDLAGNKLDGYWVNPTSTTQASSHAYPSGNGTPGTNFLFRFNMLPGDVDQNGLVQAYDGLLVCGAIGSTPETGNYTPFKDINGDGQVTTADSTAVKNQLGSVLPAGNPVAGPFLSHAPFRTGAAGGDSAASSATGPSQGPSSPAAGRRRGERRQRSPIRLAKRTWAPRCSVGVAGAGGEPSGVAKREVRSVAQASGGPVRSEAGRCGAGGDNRMGKDGVIRQMIGTNGVRGYNGVEMPAAQ